MLVWQSKTMYGLVGNEHLALYIMQEYVDAINAHVFFAMEIVLTKNDVHHGVVCVRVKTQVIFLMLQS